MPAKFARASSQYADCPITVPSTTPLTISAWIKPASLANTQTAVGLAAFAAAGEYLALGTLSTAKPFFEINGGADATHGVSAVVGTWGHICGVARSATLREVWWNGEKGTDNTSSVPTSTINRVAAGCIPRNARISFFDGAVMHVAVWNTALLGPEILALAQGQDPRQVAPEGLVFFAPMDKLGGLQSYPDVVRSLVLIPGGSYANEPTVAPKAPPTWPVPLGARL